MIAIQGEKGEDLSNLDESVVIASQVSGAKKLRKKVRSKNDNKIAPVGG